MRLLVISHTPHYRGDGGAVGWAATIRELDHLSREFTSTRHVAPLHPGAPPASTTGYRSPSIEFVPVVPAGGATLSDKLGIVARMPAWDRVIREELSRADAVHVRCPSNIGLAALMRLRRSPTGGPVWVKYAGSWAPYAGEPRSYRLQRRLLSNPPQGTVVTVNGEPAPGSVRIHAFLNPCLTESELAAGHACAADKRLGSPLRLLFVGRVEERKGPLRAIEILARLVGSGIPAELEIVGDGPARNRCADRARELGVDTAVHLSGWRSRDDLDASYRLAHFLVLPSDCSEGWPKVLSEAMAYGAVPLAGAVGSVPHYLPELGIGAALDPHDVGAFVRRVVAYRNTPERWAAESRRAAAEAARFGYARYRQAVRRVLDLDGDGPWDCMCGRGGGICSSWS